MPLLNSFDRRVWDLLKMIPRGRVSTYRAVAAALGNPNACRAVGNACNRNPFAPNVPCHRVVTSSGMVGGYAGGVSKKVSLLEAEGVNVKNNRVLDFGERLFEF